MARRPRPDPNQLDLFAARQPIALPAKSGATEPRGSVAPGVSHERGTFGLSAVESSRVLSALSIEHTGYRWQDGSSCCRACFPVFEQSRADRGRGYRMSVYRAAEPNLLARCVACGVPFNGETAQEELDRRRGIKNGQWPAAPAPHLLNGSSVP